MGCIPGVSGNFHSRPFAGMKTSDSRSRIMGMYFFYPLPVAEFWKYFLSFPSCSRILGMGFFPFPSRSWTSGIELHIPVPVPERQEVIPAHPWLSIHCRSLLTAFQCQGQTAYIGNQGSGWVNDWERIGRIYFQPVGLKIVCRPVNKATSPSIGNLTVA